MPFDGTPNPNMPVIEDLQRTRSFIEEHGWCQGILRNSLGQACLRGAFFESCVYSNNIERTDSALAKKLGVNCGNRETNARTIVDWNNAQGRTKEEVLQLLDDTIADLVAAKIQ